MKVLHVPFSYPPDPAGGTEIYVAALIDGLRVRGVDGAVAAPGQDDVFYWDGSTPVHRMRAPQRDVLGDMYGRGDPTVARRFGRILDEERPDLVHLHMFNREMSLAAIEEARRRSCALVFTYHTPTASCASGTLLRWGTEICDGKLDRKLCTACLAHALGNSKIVARVIGAMPTGIGTVVERMGLQGSFWTGLRLSQLMDSRHASIRALIQSVDHLVAVCHWVRNLLLLNGANPERISMCRQGLCCPPCELPEEKPRTSSPLRIAFFGRLEATKGPHVVMDAIQLLRDTDVRFDIYGVNQETGSGYAEALRARAAREPRVTFYDPLPRDKVAAVMRDYDVLAVPSLWFETGPLVVLEAFAARVPVLGSDLGGISELVTHDVDGLLVEPGSADAWAAAIRMLARNPERLNQLRHGVKRPRTMSEVDCEMEALYARVLSEPRCRSVAARAF